MNKAIFLDRDGTITKDSGHTYQVKDLVILPKVIEGLKKLQQDYLLIITTNQAGIAKGIFSEEEYFKFRGELHNHLKKEGIFITKEYFCPHHSEGIIERYRIECNCRKPKSGMLEKAAEEFDLDLKKSWMIGDTELDVLAGKKAGCKTIQVLTGNFNAVNNATFIANNFLEAADYILSNDNK